MTTEYRCEPNCVGCRWMLRTDALTSNIDTTREMAVPALRMLARALPGLLDESWIETPPSGPVSDVPCVIFFHRACLLLARAFFRPPVMQYELEDGLRSMRTLVSPMVYSRLFVQVGAVWDADGFQVDDPEDQRIATLTHDRAELWTMHAERAGIFTPFDGNVTLRWRDRRVALMMAMHARLGGGSCLRACGEDVLRMIAATCEAERVMFWDDFIPL